MAGSLRRKSRTVFVRVALLAVPFLTTTAIAQVLSRVPTRRLIERPVDENARVPLRGNVRPEANAANDHGRVDDSLRVEHMQLQMRLPAEKQAQLDRLVEDLQNPASANYHKWLTPAQFREKFSLAPEDVRVITNWLRSRGFTIGVIYPQSIDFSGSAREIRTAFGTEIHSLDVNGERHFANISEPRIPAALAAAVKGVISLNDFMPHSDSHPRTDYTVGSGDYLVVPADLATIYNFNPQFAQGISGQGQTVVVLEDSDVYSAADWTAFRNTLGLSGYSSGSFTQIHPAPPGGANNCTDPGAKSDDGEAILDAEWASAGAPSASVVLASCASTATFGGLIALQNLLNSNSAPPAIVSLSFGESEALLGASVNSYVNALYEQAASEGVSIFVSTGDEGAASSDAGASYASRGIGVSGFASTPYNVSVGGTDFGDTYTGSNNIYWNSTNTPAYGSAQSYVPEIPWNDSCASQLIASYFKFSTTYGPNGFCNSISGQKSYLTVESGSGGPSGCATGTSGDNGVADGSCAGYAKPAWQAVWGNPNDGVRDLPDVSLFAANGIWGHYYVVCYSDPNFRGKPCTGAPSTWTGYGGTSVATPIMAAAQALINQTIGGYSGNPNPIYYSLANAEYGAAGNPNCDSSLGSSVSTDCTFYDVTQGDIDVVCRGAQSCYLPSGTNGVLSLSNSGYEPAFSANSGWDFATGIGTINVDNLVSNWPKSATITSGARTTFIAGTPGTFTVMATGSPFPQISETGALPAGITFNSVTGVLVGTPGAGTGGAYGITFTASNGVGSDAVQKFTLTVDQAPAITSVNVASFTAGSRGFFTVTTTGFPSPSLSESGTLPAGVTFNGATGVFSGIPANGSGGIYRITITASNGVGSSAIQSFTLTVAAASGPVACRAPTVISELFRLPPRLCRMSIEPIFRR